MTKALPITPLTSVLINNRCVGYLISRGRDGLEAFDADDRSLGKFEQERDAVAAVMQQAGAVS
jgi:hypothetical protein